MHILGIVILIWIIRYFASNGANGGPSTANDPPSKWYLVIFLIAYFFSSVMLGIAGDLHPVVTAIGLIFFLIPIYCFPSWYAQITIRLGWVKISYWLGRMALAIHYRDLFSGGLFYGWKAAQNLKPEQREDAIHWLEKKVSSRKKTLSSGTMVMRVFLKSITMSDAQLMENLRLLNGCNKQLIPGNISRYACRFMLARDLPTGDWQLIARTAAQWHGVTSNTLASWLLEVHYNNSPLIRKKARFTLFLKYLLAGMPRIAKYLPEYKDSTLPPSVSDKSVEQISLEDLKAAEWWSLNHKNDNLAVLNNYWKKFIATEKTTSQWTQRIQELGSFNSDEILQKLVKSVSDHVSGRGGSDVLENDLASSERDRNFQLLQIKISSVIQRVDQNNLMTGIQEFEEWLSIAALAKKIGTDQMAKSQVFYMMRSPCWNWVAKLWNGKDKPLGFLICSFMSPDSHNDRDAYEFFNGIITNKYR
ncbi:MAG: hypothetical protein ABW044_09225 [Cellvibrio sp.]